jgi:ribosomal-protein-alanine N-acetyltransferase
LTNWGIFIATKPTTKPVNIFFRGATNQDINAILAIEIRAFEYPWTRQKLVDSFNNPQIEMQLMLKNEQIIGYLLTLKSADFLDILTLCIDPNFQRQGLGKKLLNVGLEKNTAKSIFLEVRVSNIAAIKFYQTYGFEQIDERKKYYANLEDAKILRLILQ